MSRVAFKLPAGAIYPRGFDLDEVVFPPTLVREFAGLNYGKGLNEGARKPGPVPVYGTNGRCGSHDKALGQPPGVILGRKGQGHLGVEWCEEPFWVIDTAYFADINTQKADPRWFYYITKYVGLNELKTGEKPGLNRDTFLSQVFPFPPLDEQRAIVEVLRALDDKIELNRQMNHALEEIASALFKSWFVDFDPIVAKADGRRPFGMDAATAALFPAAFTDRVPSEWRLGCVGDMIELQRGFDLPEPTRTPGAVPVIAAGGFHGFHNKGMVKGPGVVTGRSGKIGDVYWVDVDYWPLNTTLWVKRLSVGVGPLFAYHLLRSLDLAALNVGSAVPSLNRNHVHPIPAVVPNERALNAFESIARGWFELRGLNDSESRTLGTLRDALLPKLLSGEVRLKQAEKAVEAAL